MAAFWRDALIYAIVLMYFLSGVYTSGHVPFQYLLKLVPFAAVYFLVKVLCCLDTGNKWSQPLIISTVCSIGAFESVLGILQILGLRQSNNNLFVVTGTLSNPGPYGGLVAIIMSISSGYYQSLKSKVSRFSRIEGIVCLMTICLNVMVLPASMSRAGWAAFAVAGIILSIRNGWARRFLSGHRGRSVALVTAILILSSAAFLIKKESALGRVHMWDIECRAIAERPVTGAGPGRRLWAYGEAQADYFEQENRSWMRKRLAGSPEYTFNEYLGIGMEAGVLAMLISIMTVVMAIITLLGRNSPWGYGLIALSVFAMSSYPLSTTAHSCLLSAMLAVASVPTIPFKGRPYAIAYSCTAFIIAMVFLLLIYYPHAKQIRGAEEEWIMSRGWLQMHRADLVITDAESFYPLLKNDCHFLYDYGYALFKVGRYEKSIEILSEGAVLSSDPAFHIMTGRTFEALGRHDLAMKEYLHAHYMAPGRIYPLKMLMECQLSARDTISAIRTAEEAIAIPVNERNLTMRRLHSEIESNLQSLCCIE